MRVHCRGPQRPSLVPACVGVLAALTVGPGAHAAEFLRGERVVIGAEQVIHDDLYIAGNTVEVLGTIDGDLVVAARQARLSGVVTGDVLAAAGELVLEGDVVGSVRGAAGTLIVTAEIAEDAVLAGGQVRVPVQARVGRDLVVTAGEGQIEGTVGEDASLNGNDIALRSQIGGDVQVRAASLTIADGARIGGDLRYGSEEARIGSNAVIRGEVSRDESWTGRGGGALWGVWTWLRALIGLFLAGIALVLVFPGFTGRAEEALRGRPLGSLVAGLVTLVGAPLVAILLFVIGAFVGGWWLGLVALALLGMAVVAGVLLSGVTVGHLLLGRLGRPSAHPIWALLLGLALLLLVGAVPVLGGLVMLVATVFGLGALALAGLGGLRGAHAA